jgi:acetolactate synthase-1/2/3 large subunit
MNPGTSEMHFVAALDDVPAHAGVLCLFEGVATGAADGYARIADKPAAVLLHLGRAWATGSPTSTTPARGHTPVVNIVGDHATYHKQYDAPLESDIETVAATCRHGWVRTVRPRPTSRPPTPPRPWPPRSPSRPRWPR